MNSAFKKAFLVLINIFCCTHAIYCFHNKLLMQESLKVSLVSFSSVSIYRSL